MDVNDAVPESDQTAVSLYGQQDGSLDDFPVLKAFQQYIDAEQDKARRRMLSLCIFFGCLMTVVVTVFVLLLMHISSRNQVLNDRMIEYAMKRDSAGNASSPVVVQPPQDSAAILALTTKIEALQKKLVEDQAKAEKAAAEAAAKAEKAAADAAAKAERAAIEAAKPKELSAEQLEIKKLQELLSAERERSALEKERLRQAEILEKKRQREEELEAYRRKHYPELYEKPVRRKPTRRVIEDEYDDDEANVDDVQELINLVDERLASSDFDEDEEETPKQKQKRPNKAKSAPANTPAAPATTEKEYSIPVDVKGSSIRWNIPND